MFAKRCPKRSFYFILYAFPNPLLFQLDDCGVFYTGSLHPVYEEIPTPLGDGEYQLLNSEYSTLPFSDAYPILPDTMMSLLPPQNLNLKPSHHNPHQQVCSANKTFMLFQKPGSAQQQGSRTCRKPEKVEVRPGVRTGGGGAGFRTLDPRLPPSSSPCDSLTYQTPHSRFIGCNQGDFLPREAWTDFSGSDDWMETDPLREDRRTGRVGSGDGCPAVRTRISSVQRDVSPPRRRVGSSTREISPTCNSLESSDVTISTSSSETYPKSGSNDPGPYSEERLRNLT